MASEQRDQALVGLVLVSHSFEVAAGTAELARAMAPAVRIVPAGGMEDPESGLGTDATRIGRALEEAWSSAGVLVLIDLGSALLAAEMARDMLDPELKAHVLISPGPLVEGAVAAAVAAQVGEPLEGVDAAARGGLEAKSGQLGQEPLRKPAPVVESAAGDWEEATLALDIPMGLHARPAARLIQLFSTFDAEVEVLNATTGRGPVGARSLNGLASLQVRFGQQVIVRARGRQARALIVAFRELAKARFGEPAPGSEAQRQPPEPAASPPLEGLPAGSLRGVPASPGVAVGDVVRLSQPPLLVPDTSPGSVQAELAILDLALGETRADLGALRDSISLRAGEYEAGIIDAQILFLQDPDLVDRAKEGISTQGLSAAAAWSEASARARRSWDQIEDEHLRLRALDLDGVTSRVLAHLLGSPPGRPGGRGILIADELTPTDTAGLDPDTVLGIATVAGGPTSHSVILARSLGIPAVVGLGAEVNSLPDGMLVLLDGDRGLLVPNPSAELLDLAMREVGAIRAAQSRAASAAQEPARTVDGVAVEVAANIGSIADARLAVGHGADGVGLLRTEFLFQDAPEMPDASAQEAVYREIAEVLTGRPLTIRTLDAGSDKPLRYLARPPEANPALGVRGIRLGLVRRDLLRGQLRAIAAVAQSHPIRVMFPMIATRAEVEQVTRLLEEVRSASSARMEVGIMVEVPAAALAAQVLAPLVDFFSIGTNDLSQYTMAADRGNPEVASLADPLHPAVLRLIGQTVAAASGKWVGVCGELAGEASATALLIGLGVRELSMAPLRVPTVKAAVRQTNAAKARELADRAVRLAGADEVRLLLRGAALSPS